MQNDYSKNRQVAEELYRCTWTAVDESDLPVREITDSQQRGNGFGTRLANAFADVFAEGFEHVIAVGSDCPQLGEVEWSRVDDHLREGGSVVGPTPREEGAYLIGMTRSQFDRQKFAALPWKSDSLFSALVEQLEESHGQHPVVLDVRDDINGHEELVRLLRSEADCLHTVVERLRRVLGPVCHVEEPDTAYSIGQSRGPRTRSPPAVTSTG